MPRSQTVARLAAAAARRTGFATAVGLVERFDRWRPDLLPILTYHRVDEPRDGMLDPHLVSATPAEFSEQMAFLVTRFRFLSLAELLEVRAGRGAVPPHSLMVTFDDGYRDFAEHAWPTMRELGIPATLFVPTAFADRPERSFWWDRLYQALGTPKGPAEIETPAGRLQRRTPRDRAATFRVLRNHLKGLPYHEAETFVEELAERLAAPAEPGFRAVLGWDELRRVARQGVVIGSHSTTHALLARVPLGDVRAELDESLRTLERELGSAPPVLAYPGGSHDDGVVSVLREAGIQLAFTLTRGHNELRRQDWLRLRRINVGFRSTLPMIRAQLLPSWGDLRRRTSA